MNATVAAAAWNDAVTNLTATVEGSTVTLTWDHEAGAEAYGVYEAIDGVNTFLTVVYEKQAVLTDVAAGDHSYVVYSRQKNGGTRWQYGKIAAPVNATVTGIVYDNIVYAIVDGGLSVRGFVEGYSNTESSIVIPEIVEGYTVVAIGVSAFEGNTVLTSIDLPDTITVIGAKAFKGCINLSHME